MSAVTRMYGEFDFPCPVLFGAGSLKELPERIRGWGQQALVVTDDGLVKTGAIDPVLDALQASHADYSIFQDVESNPTESQVVVGTRRAREVGADFLIAVGGGSPMDVAKAIRVLMSHDGRLSDFIEENDGASKIRAEALPPLLCIPTTAGSGSEVGRSAVITMTESNRKKLIYSPHAYPTLALCDPELTYSLPASLTAGTGADALIHSLEAYCVPAFHPLCDALALDGMRRAAKYLPRAVQDGFDVEARSHMMLAASIGAIAFQKGVGAAHSLSHPLSTFSGAHHGTANAIVMPHVLRFNGRDLSEKIGPIATALGVERDGLDAPQLVERVADFLTELFRSIGLPENLRAIGVNRMLVNRLSREALADLCHQTNPRVCTEDDLRDLYLAAL